MVLIINRAILPPTIPNNTCENATEENRAPSLANKPSDAELKTKKPIIIRMIVSVRSVLSKTCRILLEQNSENCAYDCKYKS